MNRWSITAFAVAALTAGCAAPLPLSANWYLTAEDEVNVERKRLYLAVANRGTSTLTISELRVNAEEDNDNAGYPLTPICAAKPLSLAPGAVYVALLIDYNAPEEQQAATCGEGGDRVAVSNWPKYCVLPSNLKVTIVDKDPPFKRWSLGYGNMPPMALPAVLPNALPSEWGKKCGWRHPSTNQAGSPRSPAPPTPP